MKGMKRKLLLISTILALLCATLVFAFLQSLEKPKNLVTGVTVLVAAETIPERTQILAKMVKRIQVPESELVRDYLSDIEQIAGKYAKSTIEKNEGFLAAKLVSSKDSNDEITIKLKKGFRAVSVNATGESGISKLLKPGDHVDVFMYLSEKKENQVIVRPELARMLLQNSEVLAIDRRLARDATVVEEEKETTAAFLVTLAVPVEEVGRLVLAEDIGNLKLALRSGEKEDPYIPKTVTEKELYSLGIGSGKAINTLGTSAGKQTAATKQVKKTNAPMVNKVKYHSATGKTAYRYYTVKPGDTLMSISRAFYHNNTDYMLIKNANRIDDRNGIQTGTRIKVPVKNSSR